MEHNQVAAGLTAKTVPDLFKNLPYGLIMVSFDQATFNTVNESTLRLSQMGLVSGSTVRMIKKNPFGGPLQLKLNDYYIAIRKEDAQMIHITK